MRVRPAVLALVFSLCAVSLFAQATGTTTGDIRGRVTDESGGSLPGVTVTATGQETGLARSAMSAGDGFFVIRLLPPGIYRVTAVMSGFRPGELSDVRVTIGSSANVDFALRVAGVAEAVTVRGQAGLIDPASTEVAKTIGETKIRNLPINQRNFLDFALTTPGVTAERGPQSGAASTSGLSINGQSPRYNNVVVDGMDNNDEAVGSVRSTFSQEAVQEYQVVQSPFASEYGRMTGGIVNIVTRSPLAPGRSSAIVIRVSPLIGIQRTWTFRKSGMPVGPQYSSELGNTSMSMNGLQVWPAPTCPNSPQAWRKRNVVWPASTPVPNSSNSKIVLISPTSVGMKPFTPRRLWRTPAK